MKPEIKDRNLSPPTNVFTILGMTVFLFVIGLLFSLVIFILTEELPNPLLQIVIINSIFLSIGVNINIGILNLLINRLKNFYIILISFGVIIGFSFVGLIFTLVLYPILIIYQTKIVYAYLILNFIFILSLSTVITGFFIYQKIIRQKSQALDKETELRKQMENQFYAAKINPHFLFNSLNLMLSLTVQPEKMEKIILSLADILRFFLDASEKKQISLKQELEITEKYLFIQKNRFAEKLDYTINCNTDTRIPPLIIQPLVENCIKHNIKETDKLTVEIEVKKISDQLTIKISDNLKRLKKDMIGKGKGLVITKKRVELANGVLKIKNGEVFIQFSHDKNNHS